MTAKQSKARLIIYVLIAMVTTASSGVLAVDFSQPKQVAVFVLAIAIAGLNTARSYVDTTPSQIPPQ